MKLRKIEKTMLEKGYASVRMVAEKIGRSHVTVNKLIEKKVLKSAKVSGQKFVQIDSLKKELGVVSNLFDLQNWENEG